MRLAVARILRASTYTAEPGAGDQDRHGAIADELAKAALGFKHAGGGIILNETATCLRFEARKPTSAAPSGSCELLRVAA